MGEVTILNETIEHEAPQTTPIRSAALSTMHTSGFNLVPTTFDEGWRIAQVIASTEFCPKSMRGRPADVLVCLAMGAEVGLSPMQAIQGIAVINGRPSLWGDALMGIVRRDPSIETIKEWMEGEGEAAVAFCTVTRVRFGKAEETTRSFSVADAKTAKLWNKKGRDGQDTPWITYPNRMLAMRARSWALRDAASDIIKGLGVAEEMQDAEPMVNVTPVDNVQGLGDDLDPRVAELQSVLGWKAARLEVEMKACGFDVEKLLGRMQKEAENPNVRKSAPPPPPAEPLVPHELAEAVVDPNLKPPAGNGVKASRGTLDHLFGLLSQMGIGVVPAGFKGDERKEKEAAAKADRLRWAARYNVVVTSFTQLDENVASYLIDRAGEEGPTGMPVGVEEAE